MAHAERSTIEMDKYNKYKNKAMNNRFLEALAGS